MSDPKLSALLSLIARSTDVGDGWREVSAQVMPLVATCPDQSLIEWERLASGTGRVRLSPKGKTVSPYLGVSP